MIEAKYLFLQNQSGQTIFLHIKAKDGGLVELIIYSEALLSYPPDTVLCELENGSGMRIENRDYTNYHVIDRSRRNV